MAGLIGRTFGSAFHIPIMSAVVMCIVCGIEMTSIVNNYFEYKGINKKFNGWKFFSKLTGNNAIEGAIEEKEKDENSDR